MLFLVFDLFIYSQVHKFKTLSNDMRSFWGKCLQISNIGAPGDNFNFPCPETEILLRHEVVLFGQVGSNFNETEV